LAQAVIEVITDWRWQSRNVKLLKETSQGG
jgi:hypothetical protein